jgi:YesN/AraC family two-component response regulator
MNLNRTFDHLKKVSLSLGIPVKRYSMEEVAPLKDLAFPFSSTKQGTLYFWRKETYIYAYFSDSSDTAETKANASFILFGPYFLPETDIDLPYINSLIDEFIELIYHFVSLVSSKEITKEQSLDIYLFSQEEQALLRPYNTAESIEEFYRVELILFCHIKDNNRQGAFKILELLDKQYFSQLSIAQLQAQFISIITLLTRVEIEQGNPVQTVFKKQEFHFKLVDHIVSPETATHYLKQAIIDFFTMLEHLPKQDYSATVMQMLNYLENHLHEKITLNDVACSLSKNSKYLGRLFKQEVHSSFKDFLLMRRIHEAKKQLLFTDLPIGQIGTDLAFSNQSHFTECFKKHTNFTPKKYRTSRSYYAF